MSPSQARTAVGAEAGKHPSDAAILVVESNASIGLELVEQLRADGYQAIHAHTGEHARVLAGAQAIRAIVLGVLDAPRGALDLLEEIRCHNPRRLDARRAWDQSVPAILISPSATQLDLLRAFEMGADDFIPHPAAYLELRARLRAVLRRAEWASLGRLLRVGALEIDTAAHSVRAGAVEVVLCRLEYELLVHLARDPTAVFSKGELLRAVWGSGAGAAARTVDSHASRLRRKLHAAGASGLVVNVWGVGYRLV